MLPTATVQAVSAAGALRMRFVFRRFPAASVGAGEGGNKG